MLTTKDDVVNVITAKLREYLNSDKPYATQSNISMKSGIPESTVNRYVQGEGKNPTAKTAFSFLSFFDGEAEAAKMLERAYPTWWKSEGADIIKENKKQIILDRKTLTSPLHADIFLKASFGKGISTEYILEKYGEAGKIAVDSLEGNGLVIRKAGSYVVADSQYVLPNADSVLTLMRGNLDSYDHGITSHSGALICRTFELKTENCIKAYKAVLEQIEVLRSCEENDANFDGEKRGMVVTIALDWNYEVKK